MPIVAGQTPLPSPETWRERLDASRGTTTLEADVELWPELRRRFREISLRTRSLLEAPLEAPPLQRMAELSLRLSQLAFGELNRFDVEPHIAAAGRAVAELLDDDRRVLDLIAAQRRLVAELHAAAELMHASIQELVHAGASASRWLAWSEEFQTSVQRRFGRLPKSSETSEVSDALLPLPGVRLDESLHRAGWRQQEWYVQAFGSARLAAAIGNVLLDDDTIGVRRITAAALVQDLGLWDLQSQLVRNERSKSHLLRQHPAVGAAILGGVAGCPTEIVSLVGSHHERVDLTGQPLRKSGRRLSRRAQVLGLIARFNEVAHSPGCHAEAELHDQSLALVAGRNIWNEACRGGFREDLVLAFLDALEAGLSECVLDLSDDRSRMFVDRRHSLPPPHAPVAAAASPRAARQPIPEPMYLRRQRGGGRRIAAPVEASNNLTKAVR